MNKLFESVDLLFSSSKSVTEGYSLGDDKESFDIWKKEEKNLKEIVDYIKDYCDVDFGEDYSIIEVDHSQDSIYNADFMIKNLPESALDKESELYDKYSRNYSFINNIQISKWYGDEVVCFIGFDIDAALGSKSRLGSIVKEVLTELKGTNESSSITEDDSEDVSVKEKSSIVVCRVDMPISVAKGNVRIDDEYSYSTSNARNIFSDKKVYYSNNVPVDDEDFIKGGPWWMPRFQCNIKLYNDKECTDFVGTLEKVSNDIRNDLRSKYEEDYWGGVSYDISVQAEFYNAETNDLIWKGKEW